MGGRASPGNSAAVPVNTRRVPPRRTSNSKDEGAPVRQTKRMSDGREICCVLMRTMTSFFWKGQNATGEDSVTTTALRSRTVLSSTTRLAPLACMETRSVKALVLAEFTVAALSREEFAA